MSPVRETWTYWRGSKEGLQRWSRAWRTSPKSRGRMSWDSDWKRVSESPFFFFLMGGHTEEGARLFPVVSSAWSKEMSTTWSIRNSLWTSGNTSLLVCDSNGTGWPEKLWSFLLGDLQKPPERDGGYLALGVPVWAGIGSNGLRGPFQLQPFSDSVKTFTDEMVVEEQLQK